MPAPTPEDHPAPPPPHTPGGRRLSLREWTDEHGLNLATVRVNWVGTTITDPVTGETVSFPKHRARRPPIGKSPGAYEYDEAELEAFRRAYEAKVAATAGRREPIGEFPPDDEVTDTEAARRLNMNLNTFTSYDSLYRRGDNPMPLKKGGRGGTRRWGDVLAWNKERIGQGRRDDGSRAPSTRAGNVETVVKLIREVIERTGAFGEPDAEHLAAALGVKPVTARGYLAEAVRQVVADMRLITGADIARRLPGGDTASNRKRAAQALQDGPAPVITVALRRYYRPEDAPTLDPGPRKS